MALASKLLDLLNCNIRFNTLEGEYEGLLRKVIPAAELVVVGKVILLPDRRMGTLNFGFSELSNIRIISQPDSLKERDVGKKDILPVYPKTGIERMFDFDGSSDIEDGESADRYLPEYEMKLVPHLSKFLPRDIEIIDSFNKEFNLAIKHIKEQAAIGVSLEGIRINRSGILTWLCISTPCCNFLFDILALGEQVFQKGLKSILEDAKIQKILHDCRLASDCLYHKYNVCLVNVFDTQVADFIVMMQMIERDKIDSRVNTLDACLSYYLEVPSDYLYGHANFGEDKDSLNFHALRPLRHEIQDVLVKNVMYLHLLKRELELALQTPLRRATDVYLNSIQKLKDKELHIVPHKPDELPAEMHLEGIQIFRYRDFEYLGNTVASGPPYRTINNPMIAYLNYHAEYKNDQKKDEESKHVYQNGVAISSELNYKSVNPSKDDKSTSRFKSLSVNSSVNSSESDHDCSNDSEKNQSNKNIMKSEVLSYSDSTIVQNPIMHGMLELASRRSRENQEVAKVTCDESNQVSKYNFQTFAENFGIDSKSAMRDSNNTDEFSHFKSVYGSACSMDTVKTQTSQIQQPFATGKKSSSDLLELISNMKSLNPQIVADTSSDDDLANEIDDVKNAELLQINNFAVKNEESCSDSDLEEVAARVRARGILFQNLKTETVTSDYASVSDLFSKKFQVKPSEETSKFSRDNVECASENVTVYYCDTIDKSSKFAVKVNRKNSLLSDLYKKAGDGNLLWTEENAKTVSKSLCNQSDKCANKDNFWAAVLGHEPCKPIDEKLRLRLIPAGMSGY
ncbi:piRNA biogenesis protein EXD1 like protein [Argiope bruennichi]|uniref:PiRNA biogenesis protein EXD1 like protein n=1 Tax=Argiope bruennichi TaxID=94029 RepID=A0A8T0EWS0_ARGBR|nr:piRNA biogenesis protein EXD1 like protein [Argiope bruennichi]